MTVEQKAKRVMRAINEARIAKHMQAAVCLSYDHDERGVLKLNISTGDETRFVEVPDTWIEEDNSTLANMLACGWNQLTRPANKEQVKHPAHYNAGKYEVIDVIDDYVARAKHKDHELQDLKKAEFYLSRLIRRLEEEQP